MGEYNSVCLTMELVFTLGRGWIQLLYKRQHLKKEKYSTDSTKATCPVRLFATLFLHYFYLNHFLCRQPAIPPQRFGRRTEDAVVEAILQASRSKTSRYCRIQSVSPHVASVKDDLRSVIRTDESHHGSRIKEDNIFIMLLNLLHPHFPVS